MHSFNYTNTQFWSRWRRDALYDHCSILSTSTVPFPLEQVFKCYHYYQLTTTFSQFLLESTNTKKKEIPFAFNASFHPSVICTDMYRFNSVFPLDNFLCEMHLSIYKYYDHLQYSQKTLLCFLEKPRRRLLFKKNYSHFGYGGDKKVKYIYFGGTYCVPLKTLPAVRSVLTSSTFDWRGCELRSQYTYT